MRKIADAGCVHLSKPAEPETLTQQIQAFLAAKQPPTGTGDRAAGGRYRPAARGPPFSWSTTTAPCATTCRNCCGEHGHAAEAYASGEAFLEADRPDRKGCLVVDALMPGMGGIALLERLKARNRGLPAIMITGHGDIAMAVQAMKAGAVDFLEKPVRPDELSGEHRTRARARPGFGKARRAGGRARPSASPA